jgi:hypothetical protein
MADVAGDTDAEHAASLRRRSLSTPGESRLKRDTCLCRGAQHPDRGTAQGPRPRSPEQALHIIHNFPAIHFRLLHPAAPGPGAAI